MPKCTIDGREIEVPAGTTVLVAALQHGIPIQYFCWHPDLSVDGNCRTWARHFCMEMRGVAKAGATTTTSAIRGAFSEEPTRQEFLGLLRAPLGRKI